MKMNFFTKPEHQRDNCPAVIEPMLYALVLLGGSA